MCVCIHDLLMSLIYRVSKFRDIRPTDTSKRYLSSSPGYFYFLSNSKYVHLLMLIPSAVMIYVMIYTKNIIS